MGDRLPTPPEQVPAELPVIYYPPPLPVERTWREKLAAWVPRFSLLNLLFLTLLIGLAASFISLKASSKQQVAELEQKIRRNKITIHHDRRLFESYTQLPHPANIREIRLLPRKRRSEDSNQYNLLLVLDPAKNYLVELQNSNSANELLIMSVQKAYLRALSTDSDARSILQLEVRFWGENAADFVNPTKPFVGRLDFYLRWSGWNPSSGFDVTESIQFGNTPRIEMYKNERSHDFSTRFTHPPKFKGAAELARFKWFDAKQEVESYAIVIKEVPAQELPSLPANKSFLFSALANP